MAANFFFIDGRWLGLARLCGRGRPRSQGAQGYQERRLTDIPNSRADAERGFISSHESAPGEVAPAYHGGASFDAIGRGFDNLGKTREVICADVLDAWFPPSPQAMAALSEYLAWAVASSPPAACEGLVDQISRSRGVDADAILPGAGSSALIFLAFTRWLAPSSRALVLDPSYGEYAHVLENAVGCKVDRFALDREDGYAADPERLEAALGAGYDIAVIVNPNNPTGRHIPRGALAGLLANAPRDTLFWIDETYVDYAGADESLERFAARSRNVVACKSMSKAYALSGLRVGYLCGHPRLLEPLRRLTPPWAVSLPGQMAATIALRDSAYYAERYAETRALRESLADGLLALGNLEITPSAANWLLFHMPDDAPPARTVIARCRERDLFLRDPSAASARLGGRALRIAVKDAAVNRLMIDILKRALSEG